MLVNLASKTIREEEQVENYDLVKQAIQEKKQIHANYRGYARQMCPHVIGGKYGAARALFYQFGGQSNGDLPQWHSMNVDELTNVSVVAGRWHTAFDHSRPQTGVDEVDVDV
jgi:hypothetical protein